MAEELARAWTSTSTAAGSTSSSPTTRTRRRRRWPAAASRSRACGCTTGCSSSPTRRCPSRSGNIRGLGEVLDQVGGEALVLYFSGGHYRQPIAFSDERLEEAVRSRGADPRGRAAARAGRVAGGAGAAARRVLRRAGRRLQHRARAGGALRLDPRGEPARAARSAAATCARCSTCSGSRRCSTRGGGPAGRGRRAGRAREAAAREARDWAEADRLRDELRAIGWEVRDGPQGPELVPAALTAAGRRRQAARRRPQAARRPGGARRAGGGREAPRAGGPRRAPRGARRTARRPTPRRRRAARERRLRPQRGARGAARAAAGAADLGHRGDGARRASRARASRSWTPTRSTARCGTDAHQGVCAEVDPYPYADAAELLAAPDPFIVALDEVTDPQNLGAVIRTAECAGATGVVIPERRSAEVTGAVAKASAGAVEHLPVARVRNLADFLADAKEAGCWTYGAAAGARTPLRRPGLLRRRRPGARRGGPRAAPAGRRRLRRPGLAPAARAHRFAQRQRRRGGPDVRDLAETA